MEQTTTPAPQLQNARPISHLRAYGVAIVVLLIVIAGGLIYLLHSGFGTFYGITYLQGPYETRSLEKLGLRAPRSVSFDVPGRVIDYAHAGNTKIGTVVTADGLQNVYLLGRKSTPLTTDGTTKADLAISSDAGSVVYAQRMPGVPFSDVQEFYDIKAWNIQLLTIADKSVRNLGTGFAPTIFSHQGTSYIAYLTDTSIRIVNASTLATQDIPLSIGSPNVPLNLSVSPDGAFILVPDVANSYSLYALKEANGFFSIATTHADLPEETFSAVFKDANTILSTSGNDTSTFIRTSSVATPNVIEHARVVARPFIFKVIPY